MKELALILVDECGDDMEYGRWEIPANLDDDLMELWKDKKVSKMFEDYPEASGWYWMDYNEIQHRAMMAVHDLFF